MKTSLLALLSLVLSAAPAMASVPSDFAGIDTVAPAGPVTSAVASVNLHGTVEFQAGMNYRPGPEFNLTVNEGETSVLTVTYRGEPLVTEYRITGAPATDRAGQPTWQLHVVRQDLVGDREVAAPQVGDISLRPQQAISLLSKGAYRGQPRNLRLTLTY